VESEGAGGTFLSERTLVLRRTPPELEASWLARPPNSWGGVSFPLVGEMRFERSGFVQPGGPFLPQTTQRPVQAESVRVSYRPERHLLRLYGAPFDATDAGTIYDIGGVDDSGRFSGRWTDGSFAIIVMRTPLGEIGEGSNGYYCAQRVLPRPP